MSIFEDVALRMELQRIVMDEIVVDTHATYQLRVPDRLIDRLGDKIEDHATSRLDEDAAILALLNGLHPVSGTEQFRFLSMMDLSDEQAARARAGVRAVINILLPSR